MCQFYGVSATARTYKILPDRPHVGRSRAAPSLFIKYKAALVRATGARPVSEPVILQIKI